MVNPLRGEARIGLEGPVLVADVNALCEIMAATGETAEAQCKRVADLDFDIPTMRIYVAALLRHHNPHVTLRQAGDVVSDDFEAVLPAIARAFTAMLPEAQEKKT